jgi:predicted transcriptional regulator
MPRENQGRDEAVVTVTVTDELKDSFEAAAEAADREPGDVLRGFMQAFVAEEAVRAAAHDTWFRAKVQEALDDPGPGIPHEEVARETRVLLHRLAARAAGRAD